MPDEEMEMAIDFGQAGFTEDIDIDLDFPVGHPDEDMDLEDFDRAQDIHNFNSDTRDELMAEGDDSSYGMVDAIEVDHNASAAAANDIDIELEHAVESIWQQDPHHSAVFHPDTEIDYLDDTTAENMDAEKNDAETSEWLPAATTSHDTATMDHANGVSSEITDVQEAHGENSTENAAPPCENHSPPDQTSHTDAEATYSPVASGLKRNEELSDVNDLLEDEVAGLEPPVSKQPSTADQDAHSVSKSEANADIKPLNPDTRLQGSKDDQEISYSDEVAQTGSDHVDESLVPHDLGQLEHYDVTDASAVKEDHVDPPQPEEAFESADDAPEYQLGGASYVDATHDQKGADDDAPQTGSSAFDRSDSESIETSPIQGIESNHGEETTVAGIEAHAIGVGNRDNPIELADHYGIYISYGETDYRLFAKSEDDDPNQYFLTDKSALDVSLTQFLTSLRDVISEEISPLDELVMEIDGLGLEFSESTTPDFLGKFTFGDLVVLYDKLVRNEEVESYPPIYTFLTVKPNCNRRMMALGESANAGRGLSEVGLYRDSSPIGEEQLDDVESPDTNFSTGNYNDGESGSVYPQDFEEGDALNGSEHQNSPPVTAEVQLEHVSDQDEEADGFDNENGENSADGSVDPVDHEHDASISKQDDTISESSALQLQEVSEHRQQPNMGTPEADPSKPIVSKTTPANPSVDAPNSENTSVTATLDGEDHDGDHDEIGYDSDEDNESIHTGIDGSNMQKQSSIHDSNAPVDDEITWESDDDDTQNETKGGSPRDTVQVSPVSGKRSRADSEALDDAGDKNDYKRLRT